MSSTYTAQPAAAQAPSSAPGLNVVPLGTMPSDGDALSVASVAQRIKVALDGLAWTWDTTIGMLPTILSRANVWMGQQTFQAVTTVGDEIDSFNAGATTADWSLFLNGNFGSLGHFRLYYSAGRAMLTMNALYTAGSPGLWSQDVDTKYSLAIMLDGGTNQSIKLLEQDPATPDWVDSSWLPIGLFAVAGGSVPGTWTAGGDVKASRIRLSGSAITTGSFAVSASGMGSMNDSAYGTDQLGRMLFTIGGTPAATTVTLTFASGTWTTIPNYIGWAHRVDTGAYAAVNAASFANTVVFTFLQNPAAGVQYSLHFSGFGT